MQTLTGTMRLDAAPYTWRCDACGVDLHTMIDRGRRGLWVTHGGIVQGYAFEYCSRACEDRHFPCHPDTGVDMPERYAALGILKD